MQVKNIVYIVTITLMLLLSGCSGSYEFEESNLDDDTGFAGKVEVEDQKYNVDVNIEKNKDEIMIPSTGSEFTLVEEEIKVITLDGKSYEIELERISSDYAEISINGEDYHLRTYEIGEDDEGEFEIIVLDVISTSRVGVKGYADFFISSGSIDAKKLNLECFDSSDSATGFFNEDLGKYNNYCLNNTVAAQYSCSDDDLFVEIEYDECNFNCYDGECNQYAPNCNDLGYDKTISLGENETQMYTDISGRDYEIVVLEVSEYDMLIMVNGLTRLIYLCENEEIQDLEFKVLDLVASTRDSVKGFAMFAVREETDEDDEEIEIELGDERMNILIGEGESHEFHLFNETHIIEVLSVDDDLNAQIKIDGETFSELTLYNHEYSQSGVYIIMTDIVYSARESVMGYIDLEVSVKYIDPQDLDIECHESYGTIRGYFEGDLGTYENHCLNDSVAVQFSCVDDDISVELEYDDCDYGCFEGTCNYYTPTCNAEGYDETISLGEGEMVSLVEDNDDRIITIQSVSDDKVLISVGSETASIDLCDAEVISGLEIKVIDLVSSTNDAIKGYVEFAVNIITESSEGGSSGGGSSSSVVLTQTDYFDFGEDTSSHSYTTSNFVYEGAYACQGETKIGWTQYGDFNEFQDASDVDNSIRMSNCAGGDGEVSLFLDVNSNVDTIRLEIKEGVGYRNNLFGLKIDGVDFGKFDSGQACQPNDYLIQDDVLMNLTSDGKIKITFYEGVSGSCDGDPQFTSLKVFS
ncbi:MAG: hypothetical protein PF569_09815 [Candidatus Woesearchaeota archaeon]|jgi:RNase P/RNase MRP subunit p29|nr:hypothetical protein [Candidatus Woesearchaeota archaeon]